MGTTVAVTVRKGDVTKTFDIEGTTTFDELGAALKERSEFNAMKGWKQQQIKKAAGLY